MGCIYPLNGGGGWILKAVASLVKEVDPPHQSNLQQLQSVCCVCQYFRLNPFRRHHTHLFIQSPRYPSQQQKAHHHTKLVCLGILVFLTESAQGNLRPRYWLNIGQLISGTVPCVEQHSLIQAPHHPHGLQWMTIFPLTMGGRNDGGISVGCGIRLSRAVLEGQSGAGVGGQVRLRRLLAPLESRRRKGDILVQDSPCMETMGGMKAVTKSSINNFHWHAYSGT